MDNNETVLATNFKPAGKRILILPDAVETKSKGGIMLPETSLERPQVGTIIAVGVKCDPDYEPGDRVAFGKSAGLRMDFDITDNPEDAKEHWLMQESEIFGWL